MNELINVLSQDGNLVVSSREVASNFEKEHNDTKKRIRELEKDMGEISHNYFIKEEYKDTMNRTQEEYLLTRDGFSLLVMGFTGQKALQWKLKYIEAFSKMEEVIKNNQLATQNLSPELQVLINLELKQKELEGSIAGNKQEIQDMRDVISLDTTSWRKETTDLINKMSKKIGGFEHIKAIREESYKLLDVRMGVSLSTRRTNKRRRMADEGVCKSRRDKLNYLDIIAEDKKLIEGYLAIIKEMAIKYRIA